MRLVTDPKSVGMGGPTGYAGGFKIRCSGGRRIVVGGSRRLRGGIILRHGFVSVVDGDRVRFHHGAPHFREMLVQRSGTVGIVPMAVGLVYVWE